MMDKNDIQSINLALIDHAIKVLEMGVQIPFRMNHEGIIFTFVDFDDESYFDQDERGGFQYGNITVVIIYPPNCGL